MKKTLAIAVTILGIPLAASPAAAEDEPFAGPRIGIEAGWARVKGGEQTKGSDGFTYNAVLGYDLAAGPVRIGAEAKVGDSTQRHCEKYTEGGPDARVCQRSDRDLYVGGRLGFVASPQVLIFAAGGYSNARFSHHYRDLTVGPVEELKVGRDIGGYRVGGGVEYAVTPNIYVTGAYQFSAWKHEDWKRHIHQNQVLAGVGYRF